MSKVTKINIPDKEKEKKEKLLREITVKIRIKKKESQ